MTKKEMNILVIVVGLLIILGLLIVGVPILPGASHRSMRNRADDLALKSLASSSSIKEIVVGKSVLRVEVVDEPDEIQKGLGYRDELGSDGMLFVMPSRGIPSFWMKGMRFPLDMIWIDCNAENSNQRTENNEDQCIVVDVTENVPVAEDSERPREFYSPGQAVTHVLEVVSGWVEENSIELGEEVVISD